MVSPTPKARRQAQQPPSRRAIPSSDAPEPVDPIWLLKAFGVVVIAALLCGYLTLCLIFYQGQWQLVLHPSRSGPAPAAIAGAPIQIIHFGVDESGTPQLTGWWLPSEPAARYAAYTVLYLPGGDGSLASSDNQPTLAALHTLGLNLFAFDYRGYGQSAASHPNQQRMTQDAAFAWDYLTVSRAIPPSQIILFGKGVGSFLAAHLAAQHSEIPAILLDSPRPDLLEVVLADPRVKSLPIRVLFHDRFDISHAVKALSTPKLFLIDEPEQAITPSHGELPPASPSAIQLRSLVDLAASPKRIVHLTPADRAGGSYSSQISRFLDEYFHK